MDDEESGERDAKQIAKSEKLPAGFGEKFRPWVEHYIPPVLPELIPRLVKIDWRTQGRG